LGHLGEESTRAAKGLGMIIKQGPMQPCEACAAGKARQKNLPTNTEHEVAKKGEDRIFLDISTIKTKDGKHVYKSNWRIMVDERTELKLTEGKPNDNGPQNIRKDYREMM
jgi:hypothetical protein